MIVDVHTHLFPDKIALDAVPKMAAEAGVVESLDGRHASLLSSMERAGIDCGWVQPVATRPKQVENINRWMEDIRSDRLVTFGALHPDCEDGPDLVRDLASRGFPGIKLHPEYQKFQPEEERMFPVYEALCETGLIVLFHAGVDIGIPTLNSTPKQFAAIHQRFPKMKTLLAHMGGFRQWKEVATDLAGKDVDMDMSYVLGHLPDEEFVALVRQHGVDRVLFGTDSPWADQEKELAHLRSLPFSTEELEKILGSNAVRLLG